MTDTGGTGGGGIVIIGDEDIATVVANNLAKVAPFRQARASKIITDYRADESSIDKSQQLFLLRCCADILDND